jgi:hypothetical protein|tara:strand:- start:197 stop:421 length:225 start_codon:yes stop_codon:yes gene_type:complete
MTQTPSVTDVSNDQVSNICQHYWVIQPATGPLSKGVCETCGESKEFQNYIEASTWRDDKIASGEDSEDSNQTYG